MKAMGSIYDLKKDIYVKKIIILITKIKEKITQNDFYAKLEKCGKKERELIKKALDSKNNKKPKFKNSSSTEFQKFIKISKDKFNDKKNKIRKSTTNINLIKNKIETSAKKK